MMFFFYSIFSGLPPGSFLVPLRQFRLQDGLPWAALIDSRHRDDDAPAGLVASWSSAACAGLERLCAEGFAAAVQPFPGLFLTAALIAFLLDLPCRWLSQRGLSRPWAIVSVVLVTLGLLVRAVALLPSWLNSSVNCSVPGRLCSRRQSSGSIGVSFGLWTMACRLILLTSAVIWWLSSAVWPRSWARAVGVAGGDGRHHDQCGDRGGAGGFSAAGADPIVDGLARWLPDRWRDLVQTTLERTFRGYFAGQVVLALILSGGQLLVFTALNIPYEPCSPCWSASPPQCPMPVPFRSFLSVPFWRFDPRTGLELLAAAIVVGHQDQADGQHRGFGYGCWSLCPLVLGGLTGLVISWDCY